LLTTSNHLSLLFGPTQTYSNTFSTKETMTGSVGDGSSVCALSLTWAWFALRCSRIFHTTHRTLPLRPDFDVGWMFWQRVCLRLFSIFRNYVDHIPQLKSISIFFTWDWENFNNQKGGFGISKQRRFGIPIFEKGIHKGAFFVGPIDRIWKVNNSSLVFSYDLWEKRIKLKQTVNGAPSPEITSSGGEWLLEGWWEEVRGI